jgi:hypothetical protein
MNNKIIRKTKQNKTKNPPSIPHQNPCILFQPVFYVLVCKQGGRATVLGEGGDTVTRETCVPTSLNLNNLGKAAVLHFALFCGWGHAKLSLLIIGHSYTHVKFSQDSHNPLPTSSPFLFLKCPMKPILQSKELS